MTNPFHYERLPSANDFCGRKKETGQLAQLITEGKNVVLLGDRHYGKASLIDHVFREMPQNRLHAVVDFYACIDCRDVAVCLYEAVYKALPFNLERKLKEFCAVFTHLNPWLKLLMGVPVSSPEIA